MKEVFRGYHITIGRVAKDPPVFAFMQLSLVLTLLVLAVLTVLVLTVLVLTVLTLLVLTVLVLVVLRHYIFLLE